RDRARHAALPVERGHLRAPLRGLVRRTGCDEMRDVTARVRGGHRGAGAWGLPLIAHARSLGRTGIHLGGATQLLFGIRGAHWDGKAAFQSFFNDAWVRPSPSDRPDKFRDIENGCYW